MNRKRLVLSLLVLVVAVVFSSACSRPEPKAQNPEPTPQPGAENPAAGLRLAPGLYEVEAGKVQAIGTLEYRDIEGGIWVVVDGSGGQDSENKVVAVVANAADFEDELKGLDGKAVLANGKKLEGASIRMAGPEIELESIEEVTDTPGNISE